MSTNDNNTKRSYYSILLRRCLMVALSASAMGSSSAGANPPADLVIGMSTSAGTTCAVMDSGDVKCWGLNDAGQLGQGDDENVGDDELPGDVNFINVGGSVEDVQTNGSQTFALFDNGDVVAWGSNDAGQLGLGHTNTIGDDELPSQVNNTIYFGGADAVELAVGDGFACALLDNGRVSCWGTNDFGQLGYGHTDDIGDDEYPAVEGTLSLGGTVSKVVAGAHHACALLDNGDVRCWGKNDFGQLGYAHTNDIGDDELPSSASRVPLGSATVTDLTAGANHTCALFSFGQIRCWGANDAGQLGYGHTNDIGDDECPYSAGFVDVGGTVKEIAAGAEHTCAALDGGTLRCWGQGTNGQLGYGDDYDIGDDELPSDEGDIDLDGHTVTSVFIGPTASSTCALLDHDEVRCWGSNDDGRLGYGDLLMRGTSYPTRPGGIDDVIVVRSGDD